MKLPKEFAYNYIKFMDLDFIEQNSIYEKDEGLCYERFTAHLLDCPFSTEKYNNQSSTDKNEEVALEALDNFLTVYYPHLTKQQKQYIYSFIKEETIYDNYYDTEYSFYKKTLSFFDLKNALQEIYYTQCNDYIEIDALINLHKQFIYDATLETYNSLLLYSQLSKNIVEKETTNKKLKV